MPELPEVEALARWLDDRTRGLVVERVDLLAISALKTFDPPLDALVGSAVASWARRGKFLLCCTAPSADDAAGVTPPILAVHLARAGWLRWHDEVPKGPAKLGKGPQALRVRFDDGSGFTATETGTEKRLSVHVVRDPADIEHVRTLGIEPLDPALDDAAFSALLETQGRAQIKGVLTDQRVFAGVGNAYSDEALHLARLSPFRPASALTADERARLRAALVGVLAEALARASGKPAAELKDAKRSGMRVHGRTGERCPVCGDVVREVAFATEAIQYCATCQTGGSPLADRRLSRLLK